jgi:uncharacterized iron-regulated membrane protein
MTDPRELQASDVLSIDCEALSGVECRVSDTQVEDIGITETFAVTLVTDADGTWSIVGTTADSTATLNELDGDREITVNWNDIELQ